MQTYMMNERDEGEVTAIYMVLNSLYMIIEWDQREWDSYDYEVISLSKKRPDYGNSNGEDLTMNEISPTILLFFKSTEIIGREW